LVLGHIFTSFSVDEYSGTDTKVLITAIEKHKPGYTNLVGSKS